MATGGGGRGTVLCLQCRVATHLPAQMPLLCLCSSLGLPSPGPCCCPWTGRTPWPSSPFSQSCIRMKGSRPFCVSLLHGFGRDSMSLTLPWDRPSTWSGRQRPLHQHPGLSGRLQNALVTCKKSAGGVSGSEDTQGALLVEHRATA